jgi:hypothetical protein
MSRPALSTLAVGDKTFYSTRHGSRVLAPVVKITKTQITVGSGNSIKRFMLDSGREVGGSTYHSAYLRVLTAEDEADVVAEATRNALIRKAQNLVDKLAGISCRREEGDRLEAIIAALSPLFPETPEA